MRDIVEDLQRALNDNAYMIAHPLISASANEIVKLRCELHLLKRYGNEFYITRHQVENRPEEDDLKFKVTYDYGRSSDLSQLNRQLFADLEGRN